MQDDNSGVTVRWAAPDDDGVEPTGYEIWYTTDKGFDFRDSVVNANEHTLSYEGRLLPIDFPVRFTVRVQSVNEDENLRGEYSNTVSFTADGSPAPLIEDVVTQELENTLLAAQNAPLCDEVDGVELSEESDFNDEFVTCTGTYNPQRITFSECSEDFKVGVFYLDPTTQEGSTWSGDKFTVFPLPEATPLLELTIQTDQRTLYSQVLISMTGDGLAQQMPGDGDLSFDFEVPIGECCADDGGIFGDEYDDGGFDEYWANEPYYSGGFQGEAGNEQRFSFVPSEYAVWLEMNSECDLQSIAAEIQVDGNTVASLREIDSYNPDDGLCGVYLAAPVTSELGQTFEVVVRTATNNWVEWAGNVDLSGTVSIGQPASNWELPTEDENFVWNGLVSQIVAAPEFFEILIPEGGRWFQAAGVTNQPFDLDYAVDAFVDPFLVVYDEAGHPIAYDRYSGELVGFGADSAGLSLFLPEGTYTLVATTVDHSSYYPNATNGYQLLYRTQGRIAEVNPATTTTTAVPSTDVRPDNQPTSVVVVPVEEPRVELQPLRPDFVLPANEFKDTGAEPTTLPRIVVPAGVSEVVCDTDCLSTLADVAGVSEGVITIQIGNEVVEVRPSQRQVAIPVRRNARTMQVTVTPTDGGAPVVLQRDIAVASPRMFPPTVSGTSQVAVEGSDTPDTTDTTDTSNGLPTPVIAIVALLALGAAAVVIRRKKASTVK